MAWTVGGAAAIAKVSVRTLDHCDEIGLLVPSERSGSGYRLYSAGDLERLHQILMDAGRASGSPEAIAVAGRHHAHLEKWFYDCSPQMYAGLARMWVDDDRFTKNIDKARDGLAAYQSAAAQAWAATRG